ncbi:MAG: family 16 glycosylhydrolase [Bacteroidota bacterium]|nr:family 16 glycosylhydrolase [Bacteroidota bacterium]
MQRLTYILFILVSQVSYSQICDGTKVLLLDTLVSDGDEWVLKFEDDFIDTTLDLSKWVIRESHQGNADGTGAFLTLDNVSVSPESYSAHSNSATGVCIVTLKKETVVRPAIFWDPLSPVNSYHYTTADLWSKEHFGWGKYEIRCRIPKGKNFTSAFWLYGQENNRGDEIDVFEFMEEKDVLSKYDSDKRCKYIQQHFHQWNKSDPLNPLDRNCGTTHKTKIDYSLDFHTYTLIWDRWGISWFVDGQFIKLVPQWIDLNGGAITKNNIKPSQVVIRNDWYPINDMSIIFGCGIQTENGTDDPSDFPGLMIVDYVKFYEKK